MWSYTPQDTMVASDSCNSGHSESYESFWHFRLRAWNFPQNGIQNFVIWLIHSWEIALQSQIFNIFEKDDQKQALTLKGLRADKN